MTIQGKFLLSYNDCPEIRDLYDRPGIYIEGISRLSNMAQRFDAGCQYPELRISNYDTAERARSIAQMNLFEMAECDPTQILQERIYINEEKCA